MLILTRKIGESIRIGHNISIKVVDLDNRQVKLGIDAPKSISVNREEVYIRIQNENKAASESGNSKIGNIADILRNKKKDNDTHPE